MWLSVSALCQQSQSSDKHLLYTLLLRRVAVNLRIGFSFSLDFCGHIHAVGCFDSKPWQFHCTFIQVSSTVIECDAVIIHWYDKMWCVVTMVKDVESLSSLCGLVKET